MPNRWNQRDLLRLTRDCELGPQGSVLLVVRTEGPYMSVVRSTPPTSASGSEGDAILHASRDYEHAVKIGEGALDGRDKPSSGVRDRVRRVVVEMRDRNGNVLAGDPQLGGVVDKIARAVDDPTDDPRGALAELVRDYFRARDAFDEANDAVPPRDRVGLAARNLEQVEDLLRGVVAVDGWNETTHPGKGD